MTETPLEPEDENAEPHSPGNHDGEDHGHHSWWLAGLLSSATGLCLSLAIAALFTIGSALNIRPVADLERVGIEEGMRLYMAFDRFLPTSQTGGPRFVFFDVDVAACERSRPTDPAACHTANPVNATISAEALEWAKRSGAAGVILDTAPFADPADRRTIVDATTGPGPWIIAPLSGRSDWRDGQVVFNRDPALDLTPAMAQGRLRLASFDVSWGDEAQDGKIRRYAAETLLRGPGASVSHETAPTVAALAAALSDRRTAAEADCRYFKRCDGGVLRHGGEQEIEPSRIAFSLPSLALQRDVSAEDYLSDRYEPIYTRLVASQLPRDPTGALTVQPESVRGRIVVIGSSALVARDQVITPIGPMAGSELIINATRSIALSHDSGAHHGHRDAGYYLREFWTKAVAAVRGAMIMTFAWLALFAVWRWAKAHGPAWRAAAVVPVVIIFTSGLLLVGFVELYFLATHVGHGQFKGHFVDVLTPLIALGLEGYTEGASVVIVAIEHRLAGLATWLRRARQPALNDDGI